MSKPLPPEQMYDVAKRIVRGTPADPSPAVLAMSATERYERLAAQFYDETGMMAPGKDQPAEMGGPDYATRRSVWEWWLAARPDAPSPREEPPVQQSEAGMPELRNRSKAWWLNRARMEGDSPASVGRDFVMETARNLRDVAKIRRAKGQDITFGPDECDRIAEMIDDLRAEITSMQQRLSALARAAEGCEAELRDGTLCGEYGPDRIALCGPCQRNRDTAITTLTRGSHATD